MKFTKFLALGLLAVTPLIGCGNNNTTPTNNNGGNQGGGNSNPDSDVLTVAQALTLVKALPDNGEYSTTVKVGGLVDSSFTPTESKSTPGSYNFNLVDSQGSESIICWWLTSSYGLPKANDRLVVQGTLLHYVDKNSNHKYEITDGSVISSNSSSTGGDTGGNTGGNSGSSYDTITISFDDYLTSDANGYDLDNKTISINGYTFSFAKSSGTNPPKYYSNDKTIRLYDKNTLTISGNQLGEIDFVKCSISSSSKQGSFTCNTGSINADSTIWTGNATSVTITCKDGQYRTSGVTIKGTAGSGGTTGGNTGGGTSSSSYTPLSVAQDIAELAFNDRSEYEYDDEDDTYYIYFDAGNEFTSESQLRAAYLANLDCLPDYAVEIEEEGSFTYIDGSNGYGSVFSAGDSAVFIEASTYFDDEYKIVVMQFAVYEF